MTQLSKMVNYASRYFTHNRTSMNQYIATIRAGDTTLLKGLTVYVEEITKPSGLTWWHGTIQLSPEQHIELGGPYRIELDDGRSGNIFITRSSPALTEVPFRGTGPLS